MPWLAEDVMPFAGNPVLGARTRPKTFERCLWVSHYAVVLKPTDRLLDWFCARIPDPSQEPQGRRPPHGQAQAQGTGRKVPVAGQRSQMEGSAVTVRLQKRDALVRAMAGRGGGVRAAVAGGRPIGVGRALGTGSSSAC